MGQHTNEITPATAAPVKAPTPSDIGVPPAGSFDLAGPGGLSAMGQSAEIQAAAGEGPPPDDVLGAAVHGLSGAAHALPHLDTIQASFGRHDVRGAPAHVGGPAADASQALGADAYATGGAAAFAEAPDLHTAAHEAAHIVQQRRAPGIAARGGFGRPDDVHEAHADAIADTVVAGESAEPLLDATPPGAPGLHFEGPGPATPGAETRTTATRHVVARGDTLWRLAERYLADGRRWREIAAVNPDRIRGRDTILVGAVLVIPPAALTPAEGGEGGHTPAMIPTEMLQVSIDAGDGLSAMQTWRTLAPDEQATARADEALLIGLLAVATDAFARELLASGPWTRADRLRLAATRSAAPAAFFTEILRDAGVTGPDTVAAAAPDLIAAPALCTWPILGPLIDPPDATAAAQQSLLADPAARDVFAAAIGPGFPLDHLGALAADSLAARACLADPTVADWLLASPAALSWHALADPEPIAWARALWDVDRADALAGLIDAMPAEWGAAFTAGMATLVPADTAAIEGSPPLLSALLGAIALAGGDAAIPAFIDALALSLPAAIVATDAAGVLTEPLLAVLPGGPAVTPADQSAVATDEPAMAAVVRVVPEGRPAVVFALLASDPAAFTAATITGAAFAGWVARDENTLRETILAVRDDAGWIRSFRHHGNASLLLDMAADPALAPGLRAGIISETAFGWLVGALATPLADEAHARTLLDLYADGTGIPPADKITTWRALYNARLAAPGEDLVFEWSTLLWSHEKRYVAVQPSGAAMDLFFHQYGQLPRAHVDTASVVIMSSHTTHRVEPLIGDAYFVNDSDKEIPAPGDVPLPTSYYIGSRSAVAMRSLDGSGKPDTGPVKHPGAGWADQSPWAVNTPGTSPLSPAVPQAMSYFQNHATHEIGHAVGNRRFTGGGHDTTPDAWAEGYAAWQPDGSAEDYARMLGFTEAMDDTTYTLSHDGGVTTYEVDGDDLREFLTDMAEGEDVSGHDLVDEFGSLANVFTALAAEPSLSGNRLVRTLKALQGSLPGRAYAFPQGIPAGQARVTFYSTRWDDRWVSYDRAAYDGKPSHYAVSSPKEMFAELYTAYYSGGALPPAIGGSDPQAFFDALDAADPAELGLPGATSDGAASSEAAGAPPPRASAASAGPAPDADRRPWP